MARATRSATVLRRAVAADLPALVTLYGDLATPQLALARRGRNVPDARDAEITRAGLAAAMGDPERCLLVAELDGGIAGFALLSVVPRSALVCDPSVRIDPLVVVRGARRRGIGRALLGAAAEVAEQRGATVLTVALPPGDRDGNRYFARLGFAPVEVRRVAPVVTVRRALGGARHEPPGLPAQHAALTPALRRRRLRADIRGRQ